MQLNNPFENNQIRNYILFYIGVVFIVILFFIVVQMYHTTQKYPQKKFSTTTIKKEKTNSQGKILPKHSQPTPIKLLPNAYK